MEHEMTEPRNWRDRAALSIEEAGTELGVGRSLIYDMARRGQLPTIRAGSRRLVPVHELRRMLGEVE